MSRSFVTSDCTGADSSSNTSRLECCDRGFKQSGSVACQRALGTAAADPAASTTLCATFAFQNSPRRPSPITSHELYPSAVTVQAAALLASAASAAPAETTAAALTRRELRTVAAAAAAVDTVHCMLALRPTTIAPATRLALRHVEANIVDNRWSVAVRV